MFYLARFFLFLLPPEFAHWLTLSILNFVYRFKSVDCTNKWLNPPFNSWANNVGLAAGFDKNAKYLSLWRKLGFGFAEIGTVTLLPQEGHSKPRIWRLPKALLNRMGMPNEGAATIAKRVNAFTLNGWRFKTGVSLGKSSELPFDQAILEFKLMVSMFNANYFTFNLSCPSAGDSEKLQEPEFIRKLLAEFKNIQIPIFIKISAGLSDQQLNDIFGEVHFADSEAALSGRRGLVMVNSLPTPSGGISGSIAKHSRHALDMYNSYATLVGRRVPVIASGGIMNAEEALDRLKFGVDLVQLYTGFIHEGPTLIDEIVRRS